MTALAAWLCLAGLGWMAGLLLAAFAASVRDQTWPPIPVPVGGRRPSTWQQVWQETDR